MDLLKAIEDVVGQRGILLGEDVRARPNESWGQGSCPAQAIVRPGSTEEVSQVMQLCHAQGQPVVPWGGLSGLVNGTTCSEGDIALSLERMQQIEHIDSDAGTMTVQAGAILQNIHDAASDAGWMFAVDFGARGSANIGGMIATNAGGNSVVRYGMTREQVLGLEAVLADGTVISSMNEMLKNNTGYDLKQLFIGAEGTLGIVTRAVLRLRPAPASVQTAFVALADFDKLTTLLRSLGALFEGKLSTFEVMWQNHYRFMVEGDGKHQAFLPSDYPYYVLLEMEGADAARDEEYFMAVLGDLIEDDLIADAVIAQSGQQVEHLWAMRDDIESIVHRLYPLVAFDISLPISQMEAYIERVSRELAADFQSTRTLVFGHLGDGNLHLAVGPLEDAHAVESLVYGALGEFRGSISAEHGIGLAKSEFLSCSRSADEIKLMATLRRALDPKGILNPGKIF